MASFRQITLVSAAGLLLAGCSLNDLWPSLTGDEPSGQQIVIAASETEAADDIIFDEPVDEPLRSANEPSRSIVDRPQNTYQSDLPLNSISPTVFIEFDLISAFFISNPICFYNCAWFFFINWFL